ncbi:aldose 1-epimerase family protein [Roseibium sp.]|uniref:aldose 1-epimerase family protein n=1 Tax=Roseibium sp. TaxID=1936156 RepID=UPI003B51F7FA
MDQQSQIQLRRRSVLLRGLADIRLVTVNDGPAAGGRLLELRSPSGVAMDIALDRGGDILRLSFRGQELGWHSANSAPAPWPQLDTEKGLGFLRGFDGFLVTCGLDHHGVATETSAADALYPLRKVNAHPLHGRIMACKAELITKHIKWDDDLIEVVLVVRQTSVFGEVLELERKISVGLSRPEISISDRVTNRGYRPTRHGILYHFNIGYPLLDRSAKLVGETWDFQHFLDNGSAVPSDDHVEIVNAGVSPDPTENGLSVIGIENELIKTRLLLKFDAAQLPVTALWRAFQSGVFALGLEPQTSLQADAPLSAGETRKYDLELVLEDV